MSEPMAYAVMFTDSEFDYRVFSNHDEATGFAMDCVVEDGDEYPEIIPLVSGIELAELRAALAASQEREKAERAGRAEAEKLLKSQRSTIKGLIKRLRAAGERA